MTPDEVRIRLHGSVLLTGPGVLHEWPNRKFIKNSRKTSKVGKVEQAEAALAAAAYACALARKAVRS